MRTWNTKYFLHIIIAAICVSLGSIVWFATRPYPRSLSASQFARISRQKQAFVINIHPEYQGEIPFTDTFIDKDQLIPKNQRLPDAQTLPIILYDKDGSYAPTATQQLIDAGYANVHYLTGGMQAWEKSGRKLLDLSQLESTVLPEAGIELPVRWGTYIKQLTDLGVIDLAAFSAAVPMTPEQKKILTQGSDAPIIITKENSQFIVDVLWALGIAQKSIVYTEGPMGKEEKNDVGNFASTGGWNLARGLATNYLNKYDLIPLTAEQQIRVGDIAHQVYRPCCNNSTWFPDCNHGMAALAIIELLVSQNESDDVIYRKLLGFNSFWFPDSYLTVAAYFARMGIPWDKVNAKEILDFPYSSSTGASNIYKLVGPLPFTTIFAGGCSA